MIRRQKRTEEPETPNPIEVLLEFTEEDEEYVEKMLKKSARRKLERLKAEKPLIPEPSSQPEPVFFPELQGKIADLEIRMGLHTVPPQPIRNCRKCYFASFFRILETKWYCRCTNVGRSIDRRRGLWVHCESNLPCWRSP